MIISVDVNIRVSSVRLQVLAYEITTIFNKKRTPTYFIPYLSYGPSLKSATKGKLLDCLNNRRGEFRKSGIIKSLRQSSTPSGRASPALLLPEALQHIVENQTDNPASVEESLSWLRNSSDPWTLVEQHWLSTALARLNVQFQRIDNQSVASYMAEYLAFIRRTGYFLVCINGLLFRFYLSKYSCYVNRF